MHARLLILVFSALCAITTLAAPAAAQSPGRSSLAGSWCTRLLTALAGSVKTPLMLTAISDASTDSLHTGERHYIDCDFRSQGGQLDLSLHDDEDGAFDDTAAQGYAPLAGYGERARYSVTGAMGMRWVDVVRGKVACEVRTTFGDERFIGDWKAAAGRICESALVLRR